MRLLKAIGAVLLAVSAGSAGATTLMSLSNDGRYLAYEYRDALWLLTTRGGEPVKIAADTSAQALPQWSPAGDRLSFYSSRSGTLQLWVYELAKGKSRQLTTIEKGINPPDPSYLGGFGNDPLRYSWSPDGKKIVYATQVAVAQSADSRVPAPVFPTPQQLAAGEPIVLTPTTPVSWMLQGVVSYADIAARNYTDNKDARRADRPPEVMTNQLFVVEVASGKSTQLTHDDMGYFTPAWSPDDKRIAFMSGEGVSPDRATPETNIFTLDLASGAHRKVSRGRTQKSLPLWSPDGQRLAWRDVDIVLGRMSRIEGVCVAEADGEGNTRNVTRSLEGRGQLAFEWSADGRHLIMPVFDGLISPLVKVDVANGAVETLTPEGATVSFAGFMFAASQAGVAWLELPEPNGAETLWLNDLVSPPRKLAQVEPAADPLRDPRIEVLHWKNSRGEVIDGLLRYPVHYAAGKAYPMVVDAYSLVRFSFRQKIMHGKFNVERASKDYFFFLPNHRAPHMWLNPLKGARYDAAAVGATGLRIMTDDILTGVDELARRGLVDPKKLCVTGFSNGGQQGLQLLTQTDRFRCAVIQSPSTANWLNLVLFGPEDVIKTLYGVTPWEDPSTYIALSAVFQADKIHTPVLLAVGDLESQVLEAVQLFSALKYLKRDVTLLRYPTQGHGFSGAAEEDFTRRATAFLAEHLR